MKRHYMTALLLTLALAVPSGALARAEIVGASGLRCCPDIGGRLSFSFDGMFIRGSISLPRPAAGVRNSGSSGAAKLIGFAVGTVDVIMWGAPIVRALACAAVGGLGMNAGREVRVRS